MLGFSVLMVKQKKSNLWLLLILFIIVFQIIQCHSYCCNYKC